MTTPSSTTPTVSLPTTTGTSITTNKATTVANQSYNSQMFLQLLVTQLQNQDPSSPMDSSQMVQQTASLASMEQLTSLNTSATSSLSLQQRIEASNVLGKSVSWTDSSGAAHTGVVSAVTFDPTNGPQLTVNGSTVALSALTGVTEPATGSSST